MWDLAGPGIELVSLALQGRFLTTGPPGKPSVSFVSVCLHVPFLIHLSQILLYLSSLLYSVGFLFFFRLFYNWRIIALLCGVGFCCTTTQISHNYIYIYISPLPLGEGNGTPLQYSCLENPMDGGALWAAVHGVTKSQTRLIDFPFTFHFHALGKEMATHSSVLAWRIPGTAEPGGLPSMGLHRIGPD